MNIGKQTNKVEFLYLMDFNSKDSLDTEIGKYKKESYELIGEHKIDTGFGIKYNARMMKILE